jgi:DNA polymerase
MFTALTLDLETRSAVPIKTASYRRYASNSTTGILCIGLQFLEEDRGSVFVPKEGPVFKPGDKCPDAVIYAIENQIPVYAHNCPFDKRVWRAQAPKLGWPDIPEHLWRDSMAVCSYYALPRKLKDVAAALGLAVQKDMVGHNVMMQLTKPKKPTKHQIKKWAAQGVAERDIPLQWIETPEKLAINAEYCRKDVEVQTLLIQHLGHLPPELLEDWQLDQEINERGVPADMFSLIATQYHINEEMKRVNTEIRDITTGVTGVPKVTSVGARDKILDFVRSQGVSMDGLTKNDVAGSLCDSEIQGTSRRVLQLRAAAGLASIKKIKSMLDNIDGDGRLRDALVWHKASTGRWAGARWQPHNFPRDCMKEEDANQFHDVIRDQDDPVGFLAEETWGTREEFFGQLSTAMRSYLKAPAGKRFLVSDFASIESRVLAWLAHCDTMLQAYYRHDCVYSQFASRIYNREIKTKGPERQLGKKAVLGLGYGMGEVTFIDSCAEDPQVPDMSKTKEVMVLNKWKRREEKKTLTEGKIVVDLYRRTYPEIPKFWSDCEKCFCYAIKNRTYVWLRNICFGCNGTWAWIRLPSGRCIWYAEPKVSPAENPWTGKEEDKASFMGIGKNNYWTRQDTWGGTLTENIVQAVSADLLKAAIKRVNSHPDYPVILSVHDEVIAETERGTKEEFHQMMLVIPDWAHGCPVDAETGECVRYGK